MSWGPLVTTVLSAHHSGTVCLTSGQRFPPWPALGLGRSSFNTLTGGLGSRHLDSQLPSHLYGLHGAPPIRASKGRWGLELGGPRPVALQPPEVDCRHMCIHLCPISQLFL